MDKVGIRLRWTTATTRVFADATCHFSLEIYEDKTIRGFWSTASDTRSSTLHDITQRFTQRFVTPEKEETDPRVHIFCRENGRYFIRELGSLTDKMIPDNYNGDVVEGYKYIVSELSKEDPKGRLVLLEGVPGTGKTRLVRSMIGDLMGTSTCILVPPHLLTDLSGPDFALTLINQREEGKHIVLILEDADDCLIAREKNKAAKASLASLLNMSDGIMGATLDLRVVVSTNQELASIDRAILRPGRLIKRLSVGPLKPSRASAVYSRLTNGKDSRIYSQDVTLAQVYEDAELKGSSSQ